MVLAAKKLNYTVVEITPGIGQIAIFKLSGQRKVPILVDKNNVITDSSAIIRYLEKEYPNPQLKPNKPEEESMVHLLEDWADTTMANASRKILLKTALRDPRLMKALFPETMSSDLINIISDQPRKIACGLSEILNDGEEYDLLQNLRKLTTLISSHQWLVGKSISFADIAVAAQLSLLKFPKSAGIVLEGKGCPGFSDHPDLENLFHWRDLIENNLMGTDP